MKLTPFLIAGALAASLALPLTASAQQAPQPPYYPPQQQQQQPGAPMQRPQQTTPGPYTLAAQFARMFANLGITGQQQAQITTLINQYSQTHPEGSPRDRKGMKDLRSEILSILTPQQQAQYEQERAQMQAQRAQQREQRLQQQAQSQQGQPPYQGQPVPPQQQPQPPSV
jgi:hypothetical protein